MSSLPPPDPERPHLPPPPPPGTIPYYPYATASAPSVVAPRPFARTGGLARAMVILLIINVAVQVVQIPVLFVVKSRADDFLAGRISEDSYQDAIDRQAGIAVPTGLLVIAIAVLTMIWMFRLAQNHRQLGRPDTSFVPGWAIGGWFVPPGAIYAVPWLMLRELWKGSDPGNVPNDPRWKSRRVTPLLQVWWVLYGFVPLIGVVTAVQTALAEFEDDHDLLDTARRTSDTLVLDVVVLLASIAAALVYAKIVRDLTGRQRHLTGAD